MTTADEQYDNDYQLDCGRWVTIEECYIGTSMLGFLAGSPENPRVIRRVIERLPERVQSTFGGSIPHYIKPLPEGSSLLPQFVFMVSLISDLISESPDNHASWLAICWLSNDITTSLPEHIKRETRAIEWNKYAVDFAY